MLLVQTCVSPRPSYSATDHPSVQLASQAHLRHFLCEEHLSPDGGLLPPSFGHQRLSCLLKVPFLDHLRPVALLPQPFLFPHPICGLRAIILSEIILFPCLFMCFLHQSLH